MALIKCNQCGREVSDKAQSCPNCGAPIASKDNTASDVPKIAKYNPSTDSFSGTMNLLVKLAMQAIQEQGWTLENANENIGLVTFKTSISWGSWSGVSCSLNISEVSPNNFRVTGTGKQNVSGGQLFALNIGNETQNKAIKAIDTMKRLAGS
jgi:hypothetical protein